jgi:hypothetical protein
MIESQNSACKHYQTISDAKNNVMQETDLAIETDRPQIEEGEEYKRRGDKNSGIKRGVPIT